MGEKQLEVINIQDEYGYTALMWASRYGHTEIVNILIKAGANLDIQNHHGSTPLTSASRYGHTEIVKLLTKANPHVNGRYAISVLL